MNARPTSAPRSVAILAALTAALLWLHEIGHGALSAPPFSPEDAYAWLAGHDVAVVAFVVVRLLAMAATGYLLLLCAISALAHTVRSDVLQRAVDRCTMRWARGLVSGVALFGVMAAPPQPAPSSSDPLVELPPSGEVATLTLLAETPPAPLPPTAPPQDPTASATVTPETWIVEHGDSFWSIATDVLTDARGGTVTDGEVVQYWQRLIEANRDRLMNPADADLLFAGQEIELPVVVPGG